MRRGGLPTFPSVFKELGDDRKRIVKLEFRKPRAGRSRLVYGSVQNDGVVIDAGSGDWTVEWSQSGVSAPGYPAPNIYTFTVTPAFSAAIVNVLASAISIDPFAYFVGTDRSSADLDTFVVMTWDMIGDAADFDFAFAAIEDPA